MSLDVRFDATKETVWLTQAEMTELFGVDRTRITRHRNNIVKDGEVAMGSNVRKTHFANALQPCFTSLSTQKQLVGKRRWQVTDYQRRPRRLDHPHRRIQT